MVGREGKVERTEGTRYFLENAKQKTGQRESLRFGEAVCSLLVDGRNVCRLDPDRKREGASELVSALPFSFPAQA